jgi:hypothetical protein
MITWTIEQMQCLPVAEGKTNVVTTVHWRVSAVDGDFSAGAYGSCSIPFSSGTFTPFADLTEAQVCDWIWANGVDKDEIEANLNQQIATQKNPPVVTPPLPWNQA